MGALMDTNKMREQFEAAFIAEQVAKFGEGFRDSAIHLLKRDGAFLTNPSFYEVRRREQGMYDNYWVEMVWWAWQASREAVVVELPAMLLEDEDEVGEDWPVNEAYNNGIKGCKVAIEAQGLKVTP